MAWLIYSVPLALVWGLWVAAHALAWHPLLDYAAFGLACVVTGFVALIAAIEGGMRR